MTSLRNTLSIGSLVLLSCSIARAGTVYVHASLATGANDGTSWSNAFRGPDALPLALASASAGDHVWVARGKYRPSSTGVRSASFVIQDGVEVYGGFAGGETSLAQRDIAVNRTTLSGDLAGDDVLLDFGDNSYHVVTTAGAGATALLDGFRVEGGNADGTGVDARGAGVYLPYDSFVTLRHCDVSGNRAVESGGGVYCVWTSATIEDCTIKGNLAVQGGGIYIDSCTATISRSTLSDNTASSGGGVYARGIVGGCYPTFVNCVIADNLAAAGPAGGGGLLVDRFAFVELRQCTVVANRAPLSSHAGLVRTSSKASLYVSGSIVYFNTASSDSQSGPAQIHLGTTSHSCVQNGAVGAGNISSPPLFVASTAGDLHLSSGSPCIDAASNALLPAGTLVDREGAPRVVDDPATADTGVGPAPVVDMGAFEYQPSRPEPFCAGDGVDPAVTSACPCANVGASGHGCAHSANPAGASLAGNGTPNPDTLVLVGTLMPASSVCLYLQGDAHVDVVFGDGVRCAGGTLIRLGARSNVGGGSQLPDAGDPASISARGRVTPGSGVTRYYQTVYRNAPAAFCPPAAVNITNGVRVRW